MAAHRHASNLFHRLIAFNQSAFAAGRYHTAFHLLAAALHEAQYEQDADGLATVQHIAEEQLQWIDHHVPEYEHSTQAAAERGQSSIFVLLVYEAHAQCLQIEQERTRGSVMPLHPHQDCGSV